MDTTDVPTSNLSTGSYINSKGSDLLLNSKDRPILMTSSPAEEQAARNYLPRDRDWIKQSFMSVRVLQDGTLASSLSDLDKSNRSFSSASLKFTDSSIGGNNCINPPPQYTRYCDIRDPGVHVDSRPVTIAPVSGFANLGMGNYYSEAIDDHSQIIHLRFGVASYNSLLQFFTGFYSGDMAAAARSGRFTDDIVKNFFTAAGNVIGFAIAPMFLVPIAVLLLGNAARFFANYPSSKFYQLKPTMPMYWNAVNSMVNQMAVNSGLSAAVNTSQSKVLLKGGEDLGSLKNPRMNVVGKFLPKGLIKDNGTIDVYAMANRSNRMSIQYNNALADAFKNANGTNSWSDTVKNHVLASRTIPATSVGDLDGSIEGYIQRFIDFAGSYTRMKDSNKETVEQDFKLATKDDKGKDVPPDLSQGFFDYLLSQWNDGGEFASFRVDYTGPVSESFSNSVGESSLASKINSLSSSTRDIRMNMADGNLGGGIGAITDAVKGLLSGMAEVLHIEGIAAAAGSAFVDIPKHWENSTASLPKANYTMTLISPYGNPVSRLMSIWTPLAMLLAGALPLATGKESHTSPFLCELHDRGRCMTRLGIVDNISITRGTSNLGFTQDGSALAIDVSFGILDLSSIVAMPIQPGFSVSSAVSSMFDSDNSFTDYLMTLSAMKLGDTIYRIPMLKYNINKVAADFDSYFSSAHLASEIASLPGVNILSAIMRGTEKN